MVIMSGCAAQVKSGYKPETRVYALPTTGTAAGPLAPEGWNFSARGTFGWPVRGKVSSGFGDETGNGARNKGIEIAARLGGLVRAAKDGRVIFCAENFKGFGKTLIIDHGDGFLTLYAYNSELLKKEGSSVKKYEAVAKAGAGGRAKGATLYFEITKDGRPLDPLDYLSRF